MANPTVDWATRIITIPQSFLTPLGGSNYELDTDAFRLALKDIEDSEGMGFPDTHRHNTAVTLGGVVYSRFIEIINNYTVTFENGSYAVTLKGSNNNILDVTNLNYVSVRSMNSAGLVVTDASGLTTGESQKLDSIFSDVGFYGDIEGGKWVISSDGGGTMYFYKSDNETLVASFALYDANNQRTSDPTKAVRRDRL